MPQGAKAASKGACPSLDFRGKIATGLFFETDANLLPGSPGLLAGERHEQDANDTNISIISVN